MLPNNALRYSGQFIDQSALKSVYGFADNNWGDLNIFQGNFINYGFWRDIPFDKKITLEQRVQSSAQLYLNVAGCLNITPEDDVLEIGSGRGVGAIYLSSCFPCHRMVGIDITPAQIERSKTLTRTVRSKAVTPEFYLAQAKTLPFKDNAFNKIYSVEVFQHIDHLDQVANEIRRVLKPGGRAVISTYMPTGIASLQALQHFLPLISQSLEVPVSIVELKQIFLRAGFNSVKVVSIGEYVFSGYERWSRQVGAENEFTYNYFQAFIQKMIDYYTVIID